MSERDPLDGVLVLTTDEAQGLISQHECNEAMEVAFRELGHGTAQYLPRRRMYLPLESPDRYYFHNNIAGAVPYYNTVALRVDSAQVRFYNRNGRRGMDVPGDFAGFVLLFKIDSRELYGIVHDHAMSTLRVGGTSAIVSRRLARPDSTVMGLFGAGEQATAQVLAHAAVLPNLKKVKFYITSAQKRADAARRLSELSGLEVVPVAEPKEAVVGCDIITTATNSSDPVFSGDWLEPGQHVNTIVNSDFLSRRTEVDDVTVRRADVFVVNSKAQAQQDQQPPAIAAVRNGWFTWDTILEVSDLACGRWPGRTSNSQITLHYNNGGMGIQFAATGALMVDKARAKGVGTILPKGLFMTYRKSPDEAWGP